MKIGIDARFVGPEGTGLGKYTEELIKNLEKIDKKNQYCIFLRQSNWQYLKLKNKNFKKTLADVPWYSFEEQIKMPSIFRKQNLDLLHVPHFNVPIFFREKFVVTIHDLIHNHFKEESTTTRHKQLFKLKRFGYRLVIKNAVHKAKKIIVPTKFVKDEIVEHFNINPEKIVVTYEAAEEEYFNLEPLATHNLGEAGKTLNRQPFLIYVGNVYPHKNLNALLDALVIMKNWKLESSALPSVSGNWKLTIVCPRNIFWRRLTSEIKSRGLSGKVETEGYLSPTELSKLFSKAAAYIFPSLSEGFGIPGLNAMASGLPVVASDIPTLKEVYGEAALYFDPNDPNNIAQAIKKVLTDEKAKIVLVEKGKEQVKKYSWQKMAEQTLKIYNEVTQ